MTLKQLKSITGLTAYTEPNLEGQKNKEDYEFALDSLLTELQGKEVWSYEQYNSMGSYIKTVEFNTYEVYRQLSQLEPKSHAVIKDIIAPKHLESYTSDYVKLKEYREQGYYVMTLERASKLLDAYSATIYLQNVYEVDEDRYYEMLEVLPPLKYINHRNLLGFLMCEYTTANITTALFRLKDDNEQTIGYYELNVRDTDSNSHIYDRIAQYRAKLSV